jgi:hypothetical protein
LLIEGDGWEAAATESGGGKFGLVRVVLLAFSREVNPLMVFEHFALFCKDYQDFGISGFRGRRFVSSRRIGAVRFASNRRAEGECKSVAGGHWISP